MRFTMFGVGMCLVTNAVAQQSPFAARLSAEIKPHGQAYVACAIQHVQQRARAEPGTAFEQHGLSIRPACGGHIEQIYQTPFGMVKRAKRPPFGSVPHIPNFSRVCDRLLMRPT